MFLPIIGFSQADNFPEFTGPYLDQKPPGLKPEIFAPWLVDCNDFPHGPPVFSSDGNEMFLPGIKTSQNINGSWTEIEFASFSGKYNDMNVVISPDGKTLMYSSYSYPDLSLRKQGVYIVERNYESWSNPKMIDTCISSMGGGWIVSISANGTVYFVSNKYDFYKSEIEYGKYSTPVQLKGDIEKSRGTEVSVSSDESYIVFSSSQTGGIGKLDLYVSFRQTNGLWSQGVNLDKNINSAGDELRPNITADGKYIFYIHSQNGLANIYLVSTKIIENLKPERIKQRQ